MHAVTINERLFFRPAWFEPPINPSRSAIHGSRASRVTSVSRSYGDCLEERPDDYAHDYTYNLSLIIERNTLRSSAFSRSHLTNT